MKSKLFRFMCAMSFVTAFALCACDKSEKIAQSDASLEGTVKYGGEQVPYAMIIIKGKSGSAQGNIGDNLKYSIQNVPIGEVKIGVNTDAGKGMAESKNIAASFKGVDAKGSNKVNVKVVNVPKTYQDPETSKLVTTIKAGQNTYDIDIPK